MAQIPGNMGAYCAKSHTRNASVERVLVTITSGTPAITEDDGSLVASVAKAATGRILVTLKTKHKRISVAANLRSESDVKANVDAVTDGTGATNTFYVTTISGTTAADLTAVMDLILFVSNN